MSRKAGPSVSNIPEQLRYTSEHEWIQRLDTAPAGPGAAVVRVGITDHAQDALGDIVYVALPEVGAAVAAGDSLGEVESTKSVSEIFAPLAGVVVARNNVLDGSPELLNSDPYGAGWFVEIEIADPAQLEGLLSAEAYAEISGG
ncbi:MAG: glycine cleavage system protein [Pseudonocardiales bacterium]|nr:glycine cleavage system protein [Pseudonocardiales bacterium]